MSIKLYHKTSGGKYTFEILNTEIPKIQQAELQNHTRTTHSISLAKYVLDPIFWNSKFTAKILF